MSVLDVLPPVVLWALTLARVLTSRATAHHRLMTLAFGLLAAGATVHVPAASAALDTATGVANLSHPVTHGLVVLSAACVYGLVAGLVHGAELNPAAQRWRLITAAVSVAAMLALFALSTADEVPNQEWTEDNAGDPWLVPYWALYTANLGAALASTTGLSWRHAARTPRRTLRFTLTVLGAGAAAGLLYLAHKAAVIATATLDPDGWLHTTGDPVAQWLIAAAVILIVTAIGAPLATGLGPAWANARRRRALAQLHPLWSALQEATPAIVLDPDPTPGADLELALHRAVVEIRDGILAVRPYRRLDTGADIATRVASLDLPPAEVAVMVEACLLELARRTKLRGDPAGLDHATDTTGGTDLPSEIAALTHLSQTWAHPRTRRLVDTLDQAAQHRSAPDHSPAARTTP